MLQRTAIHCNTFDTAAQCRKLCVRISEEQQQLKRCDTLQHMATHGNTLQNAQRYTVKHCDTLQHTLQHTATHCTTMQEIAFTKRRGAAATDAKTGYVSSIKETTEGDSFDLEQLLYEALDVDMSDAPVYVMKEEEIAGGKGEGEDCKVEEVEKNDGGGGETPKRTASTISTGSKGSKVRVHVCTRVIPDTCVCIHTYEYIHKHKVHIHKHTCQYYVCRFVYDRIRV